MDKKQERISTIQLRMFILGFGILFFFFLIGLYRRVNDAQTLVFFRQCEDYMADFFNVISYSQGLNTYKIESAERGYLPLSYLIFFVFGKLMRFDGYDGTIASLSPLELTVSGCIMALMITMLGIQLYDMLEKPKLYKFLISGILLVSGVMLFSYERGNIILLTVSGMLFFLVTYESDHKLLRELGYMSLAVAAALKGYPAILGLLLVYKRQWKETVRLLLYGILASFGPFLLMEGGLQGIRIWKSNVALNTATYEFVQQPKLGYHYFIAYGEGLILEQQERIRNIWKPIMYGLSGIGIITGYFQKKKWMTVAMLTCIMLILPSNCGYYCLLYLFPVIILYFNERDKNWTDLIYLPLFLIMLCPFQFIQKATDRNLTLYWANVAVFVLFAGLLLQNIWSIIQIFRARKKGVSNHGD